MQEGSVVPQEGLARPGLLARGGSDRYLLQPDLNPEWIAYMDQEINRRVGSEKLKNRDMQSYLAQQVRMIPVMLVCAGLGLYAGLDMHTRSGGFTVLNVALFAQSAIIMCQTVRAMIAEQLLCE